MSASNAATSKVSPSEKIDPDELAIALFIVLVVFSVGFASIYIQCMKLVRVVRKQQRDKQQQQQAPAPLSQQDVQSVQKAIRDRHGKTREDLIVELRDLKIVQKEVKAKLAGLERMVETVSKQHQTLHEEHDAKMAQLKQKDD